jgi:hypothetical protein
MIGYIPGRVGYGSEEFILVSLHDCCIGFAGAAPQFNSIGPYRFEYRFIDEYFSHVLVFLCNIIICRLYKLTLSGQGCVILPLRASIFDLT